MAAKSAARCNPAIRAFHSRPRSSGKTFNQATVARARKLPNVVYACRVK